MEGHKAQYTESRKENKPRLSHLEREKIQQPKTVNTEHVYGDTGVRRLPRIWHKVVYIRGDYIEGM